MENPLDKVKAYLMSRYGQSQPQAAPIDDIHGLIQDKVKHSSILGADLRSAEAANNVSESSDSTSGYAKGGMVNDQTSGPDFLNALNGGEVKFDPASGMPPALPEQTPQPLNTPPAPSTPNQQYLGAQKAQLNKFGPEQQLELSNHLINQRQSLPQRGAVALGGLADSIMQGVARAGSGGFADRIQGRQDSLAKEQTDALEKAGTQNIARTEAGMKLDQMDPSSETSKTLQKAWGSLLSQNGFTPEQVAQMPASAIAALTGQSVEQAKAKAEAQLAAASLGVNKGKAAEEIRHNKEGEGIAAGNLASKNEEDRRKNLHDLTSPTNALLHPVNAWSASKELNGIASGGASAEPEHQTAIEWAKANPNDPRSKRILSLHGL